MIFSSKSQMIHVISEVVVLIGFTFYFTSKLNKLSNELVKMNEIIKSQNDRINYLENMVVQEFRTSTSSRGGNLRSAFMGRNRSSMGR